MNTTKSKITIRKSEDRGIADHGWLYAKHSFSFADYYDPAHMGYRSLRVINEDVIEAGKGFGTHPHKNMEIFTYIIEGALEHKDSMGNGRVIKTGEFQYMSAGKGVTHSEFNPSQSERTHLLQIWIEPTAPGGAPRYRDFDTNSLKKNDELVLFAGPEGSAAPIEMRQQAEIYFGKLQGGQMITIKPDAQRDGIWIQQIKGSVQLLGNTLNPGDAAAVEQVDVLELSASQDAEFLLFRLP